MAVKTEGDTHNNHQKWCNSDLLLMSSVCPQHGFKEKTLEIYCITVGYMIVFRSITVGYMILLQVYNVQCFSKVS